MFLTNRPTIQEVAYKTYVINCYGMQAPMLFVGEKKALLVDTGVGNCDLRGLIEEFVDVPIEVAVTHEHADHVGGIVQFDKVYAPELEIDTIKTYDTAFMQKFLDFFLDFIKEEDGTIGCFGPEKKVLSWEHIPELIPLHDGDSFDLGGRKVTAYRCQVHSKGHMVFVDDLTKILYAGDSVSDNTGPANNPINPPTYVSLEDEIKGLENIKQYADSFDRIFTGHMGWGGDLRFTGSFEPDVIDRMIAVGKGVLTGDLEIKLEDEAGHGIRNYAAMGKTTLYFFEQFLRNEDLPREYRYWENESE